MPKFKWDGAEEQMMAGNYDRNRSQYHISTKVDCNTTCTCIWRQVSSGI